MQQLSEIFHKMLSSQVTLQVTYNKHINKLFYVLCQENTANQNTGKPDMSRVEHL